MATYKKKHTNKVAMQSHIAKIEARSLLNREIEVLHRQVSFLQEIKDSKEFS